MKVKNSRVFIKRGENTAGSERQGAFELKRLLR